MNPTLPDARGYFGRFGGQFVAETLMQAVLQLQDAYRTAQNDPAFWAQFRAELADYVGRPSPLYFAKRLTEKAGGAEIWLKREDLNHTGAHKINNTIGQALLAERLGKPRLIAETGAGQHGVASATVGVARADVGNECLAPLRLERGEAFGKPFALLGGLRFVALRLGREESFEESDHVCLTG